MAQGKSHSLTTLFLVLFVVWTLTFLYIHYYTSHAAEWHVGELNDLRQQSTRVSEAMNQLATLGNDVSALHKGAQQTEEHFVEERGERSALATFLRDELSVATKTIHEMRTQVDQIRQATIRNDHELRGALDRLRMQVHMGLTRLERLESMGIERSGPVEQTENRIEKEEDEEDEEKEEEEKEKEGVGWCPGGNWSTTPIHPVWNAIDDNVVLKMLTEELPVQKKLSAASGHFSYKLNLTFANGMRGIFRRWDYCHWCFDKKEWDKEPTPERIKRWDTCKWCHNSQAEVFAFHLDRLLGMYRVPPTVFRRLSTENISALPWEFVDKLEEDIVSELFQEAYQTKKHGYIDGQLQLIMPDVYDLIRYKKRNATGAPTSFAWVKNTRSHHAVGANAFEIGDYSDAVVFDFLMDNYDRGLVNVSVAPRHPLRLCQNAHWTIQRPTNRPAYSRMVLIDNGHAFNFEMDGPYSTTLLGGVCKFRRQTYEAIARLTNLGQRLETSIQCNVQQPVRLFPTSDEEQMAVFYEGFEKRRLLFLRHVEECVAEFGERNVLSLP